MFELTTLLWDEYDPSVIERLTLSRNKFNTLSDKDEKFNITTLYDENTHLVNDHMFLSLLQNNFSHNANYRLLRLFTIDYKKLNPDNNLLLEAIKEYWIYNNPNLLLKNIHLLIEYIQTIFIRNQVNMSMWNTIPLLNCLYPVDHGYNGTDLRENSFTKPLLDMTKATLYGNIVKDNKLALETQKAIDHCFAILQHQQVAPLDKLYLISFMSSLITTIWNNYFNIREIGLSTISYQLIVHNLFLFERREEEWKKT